MENNEGTFIKEEEKEFSRFYKFSKWYITNRERLKKIGYGIFIAFDSILLLFVFWTFLDAYVISYAAERRAVAEMVVVGFDDLRAYTKASAAKPLVKNEVTVLSVGSGKYDFYTTVSNPNDDWWAEFTYVFRSSEEEEMAEQTGFILPAEEKPVVALGVEASVAPRNMTFNIADVQWHRVDHHMVGDYEEWYQDRFHFDIQDVTWTVDSELEKPIGKVSFTVTNDSAFSYYDPVFYALLLRGSRVVGVNKISISSIDAFETKKIEMHWFGTLPSVSQVEIIPEINLFDVDVYKPLEGESSFDTRTRVFERRR